MSHIDDHIIDGDTLYDQKRDDSITESEEAKDYQLHLDAGLIPAGRIEGEQHWYGTDKQWEDYERRVEAEGRAEALPF